jgi:cytoskeletal protein CcmA (bactofilin family)
MFNMPKRQEMQDSESLAYRAPAAASPSYRPHAATLIAKGVKLEGEFTSQGDVQIEGEVQGKITAAGTLTVGAEAAITADVTADEAVISGVLNGNLTVTRQLVLHSSARIKGDIVAERVSVESGAVIDGRVEIGTRPVKPDAVVPEVDVTVEAVSASADGEKAEGDEKAD